MGLAKPIRQAHDGVVGGPGGFGDRGFGFLLASHRGSSFRGRSLLGGAAPAGRVPPLVEYQKAGQKKEVARTEGPMKTAFVALLLVSAGGLAVAVASDRPLEFTPLPK